MRANLVVESGTIAKEMYLDDSLRALADFAARRIIEAYADDQITLNECLTQLRDEQRREISGVTPFPRYAEWVEVAIASNAEKRFAEDCEKLEQFMKAISCF